MRTRLIIPKRTFFKYCGSVQGSISFTFCYRDVDNTEIYVIQFVNKLDLFG